MDDIERKQSTLSNDEDLMRTALEWERRRKPTGGGQGERVMPKPVTLKEHVFVEAYLRTGDKREAARLAGYQNPGKAGLLLLKRPRVQEAIRTAAVARVDASKLSRTYVLEKHLEIIQGDNLFARIKSLEQVAKLQGYYAPIKHQTITTQEGNPYGELVETLRAQGASFTNEEKAQIRSQLFQDLAQIQEALRLLGSEGKRVN